jgi:hypothetical protein
LPAQPWLRASSDGLDQPRSTGAASGGPPCRSEVHARPARSAARAGAHRGAAQRGSASASAARAPPALAREADAAASAPVARLGLAVPLGELHELLQEVATDMARFFWSPLTYSSAFHLRLVLLFLTCFFSPFSLSSLAFSLKTLCRSSGTGILGWRRSSRSCCRTRLRTQQLLPRGRQ